MNKNYSNTDTYGTTQFTCWLTGVPMRSKYSIEFEVNKGSRMYVYQ